MKRFWARVASLALAGLLALAVGGVVAAHARTVGQVIDDARIAAEVTVRAPEMRMGTVARIDTAGWQLVLTDGTIVRVPASANVHRGSERLMLVQLERGAEIVVQLAPAPSASPGATAPWRVPEPVAAIDATDVNVVWTPPAATR